MLQQVRQSLCLLTRAYNHKLKYDIVIFTTTPIDPEYVLQLQEYAAPAKLTVVLDAESIAQQTANLTDTQKNHLVERCKATSIQNLTWFSVCCEEGYPHCARLGYGWQAEFRSLHLYQHPALSAYDTMMWLDSDAMCTEVWKHDPVDVLIRNNLVLLFDNFPQGRAKGPELHRRIRQAFDNRTLCSLRLSDDGHLEADTVSCREDQNHQSKVDLVHGFFHVSDLRFYRSEAVVRWQRALIGDSKFSRQWDDQISVTVAPAMLAPDRAWDMTKAGIVLNVSHNFMMDGRRRHEPRKYVPWWKAHGKTNFPEAWDKCAAIVIDSGR
jgi:hypothetical protein